MCGLLALHTLHYLTRLCSVSNHADRIVVADVFPQPIEQHHHLVLDAEDSAQVNYEPQNPCEESLAAELAYLYHSLVAADSSH